MLSIRDFWQKYPSGLEVSGLGEGAGSCTAWFYSPDVESFDFSHYDTRSYPRTSYEGFDEVRASAYGIGVTSECRVDFFTGQIEKKEMEDFALLTQKPPVYAGTPEYYHEKRAFGYWSLVKQDTPEERWLEDQLKKAFSFYQNEVEARNWYAGCGNCGL